MGIVVCGMLLCAQGRHRIGPRRPAGRQPGPGDSRRSQHSVGQPHAECERSVQATDIPDVQLSDPGAASASASPTGSRRATASATRARTSSLRAAPSAPPCLDRLEPIARREQHGERRPRRDHRAEAERLRDPDASVGDAGQTDVVLPAVADLTLGRTRSGEVEVEKPWRPTSLPAAARTGNRPPRAPAQGARRAVPRVYQLNCVDRRSIRPST